MSSAAERSTTALMPNEGETVQLEEMSADGSYRKMNVPVSDSNDDDGLTGEWDKLFVETNSTQFSKLPSRTKAFYRNQNEEVLAYRRIAEVMSGGGPSQEDRQTIVQRAERNVSYVSSGVNFILLIALILAVAFSGSLSLIASVLDSSLDMLSGIIMLLTAAAKRRVNLYRYPQGRERIEPVGVLVFSAIMGTASLMLIIKAIETLIDHAMDPPTLEWVSISMVLFDLVVKACLLAYCLRYARVTPIARVLAQDHRNDLFLNSVALGAAALGAYVWPPLDPIGSICIALWTTFNWGSTCLEQVYLLTGLTASPEFLKRLTWLCYKHDDRVQAIDTVRAFHFGSRYLVEIDVVLPPDMSLREAHDIGEALQKKVEMLEEVERAFVHLDFEVEHDPKSEHKQWGF